MSLRPYQHHAIAALFDYFKTKEGHPLVVAPTGSGKSHLIAHFIKRAYESYPGQRFIILAHRKELLLQNSEKLRAIWSNVGPIGLYSAGLNSREIHHITFAGIQSVFSKAEQFGWQSLCLIDECHLVPKDGFGMYRRFITDLQKTNPRLRVIGFTATPFRLDSGLLTHGADRIFTDIAYEIEIQRLINDGYLAGLISKEAKTQIDTSECRVRGGEFVNDDLIMAADREEITKAAVQEIISLGQARNNWLLFCTGVLHTEHVRDAIRSQGITAELITGETPAGERAFIIESFKNGKIRALCNCDVLTTGFDAPNCDLVALLRPTKSAGLYIQMVGRGSRLAPNKINCLVLDFGGNIARFGPIDLIKIKKKAGKASCEKQPTKKCPFCETIIPIAAKTCPDCGGIIPASERAQHDPSAATAPILSTPQELNVMDTEFSRHISNKNKDKPPMMRVDYYTDAYSERVSEFLCFDHGGYASSKARQWWRDHSLDPSQEPPKTTQEALDRAQTDLRRVKAISVVQDGAFKRIKLFRFYKDGEELNQSESDRMYDLFGVNI